MTFAAVSHTRERTGEGWATTSPVHLSRGRQSAWQVPYKPFGKRAQLFKLAESLPAAKLGSATVQNPSALPLFFKIVDPATHQISPVHSLTSVNMEKSVSCVCTKEFGALSASDIEKARDIHQRLVVRMMTAPGDSKGAMYRIEAAFGLSYHCQFNLRHQNRASGEFVARLDAVWLTVLEQSVTRDVAELLAEREKREVA